MEISDRKLDLVCENLKLTIPFKIIRENKKIIFKFFNTIIEIEFKIVSLLTNYLLQII